MGVEGADKGFCWENLQVVFMHMLISSQNSCCVVEGGRHCRWLSGSST